MAIFQFFVPNNFIKPKKYAIFVSLLKRWFLGTFFIRLNVLKAGMTIGMKPKEITIATITTNSFNK
jgi:hypothetical protein